ncbi:MAG: BsuBI/PstI family type II restriction endonuclease [Ignavibacteria bacterium]
MDKIKEAKQILFELGLPVAQQNDRSALTLLALCNITKKDNWKDAKQISMSVVGNKLNAKYEGIMRFISKHYRKKYAENSRETFRRQTLHQFVQAGIVEHNPENPKLPTNSKDNHYRISAHTLKVIQKFGSQNWESSIKLFKKNNVSLLEKYAKDYKLNLIEVKLTTGKKLNLSPGKHNQLQIHVLEKFSSKFIKEIKLLYFGDTANKDLFCDVEFLESLGIVYDKHKKMPDVLIFDSKKKWLFLIEVVTSHGPMSPKRLIELEKLFEKCKCGKVYVTAFPNRAEFRKHLTDIAWETEVWIAEEPSHLIHFNGDKFIGPYQ